MSHEYKVSELFKRLGYFDQALEQSQEQLEESLRLLATPSPSLLPPKPLRKRDPLKFQIAQADNVSLNDPAPILKRSKITVT
jgi:hypothetical protein